MVVVLEGQRKISKSGWKWHPERRI